jgi:hypothetical protein
MPDISNQRQKRAIIVMIVLNKCYSLPFLTQQIHIDGMSYTRCGHFKDIFQENKDLFLSKF